MQSDQASAAGRGGNKSEVPGNTKNKGDAFANKKRWAKDPNAQAEGNGDEYGHLSKFLQEQITTRSSKRSCAGSQGSKQRNVNNAIIEKAAHMRHDAKAVQELAEQHNAANTKKVPINELNRTV